MWSSEILIVQFIVKSIIKFEDNFDIESSQNYVCNFTLVAITNHALNNGEKQKPNTIIFEHMKMLFLDDKYEYLKSSYEVNYFEILKK